MAGKARRGTVAAVAELNPVIEETIRIEREIARLEERARGNRAHILRAMRSAGLTRHATPGGQEALRYAAATCRWTMERLEEVLDERRLDELCPRAPDGEALRALLDSGRAPAGLRGCARISRKERLKLGEARTGRETEVRL